MKTKLFTEKSLQETVEGAIFFPSGVMLLPILLCFHSEVTEISQSFSFSSVGVVACVCGKDCSKLRHHLSWKQNG